MQPRMNPEKYAVLWLASLAFGSFFDPALEEPPRKDLELRFILDLLERMNVRLPPPVVLLLGFRELFPLRDLSDTFRPDRPNWEGGQNRRYTNLTRQQSYQN